MSCFLLIYFIRKNFNTSKDNETNEEKVRHVFAENVFISQTVSRSAGLRVNTDLPCTPT